MLGKFQGMLGKLQKTSSIKHHENAKQCWENNWDVGQHQKTLGNFKKTLDNVLQNAQGWHGKVNLNQNINLK